MEKEYVLAIDIGGTSVKYGVVINDTLIEKFSYRNIWKGNQDKLLVDLKDNLQIVIDKYNIKKVGIGCPGDINENGAVDLATNLGWHNFELRRQFMEMFPHIDVIVENDGKAAVNAELIYGKLNNVKNGVFVVFGKGVGGAVIIDGKVYQGENKKGINIGHITYKKPNGRKCSCGRCGCYETYTSVTGLIKTIKEVNYLSKANMKLKKLSGYQIVQYIKENNEVVKKGVKIWNDDIAEEILDLAMFLDPSHIVLAGGITESGLIDMNKIRNKLDEFGYNYVDVSISRFKGNTGLIGSAAMVNKKSS